MLLLVNAIKQTEVNGTVTLFLELSQKEALLFSKVMFKSTNQEEQRHKEDDTRKTEAVAGGLGLGHCTLVIE